MLYGTSGPRSPPITLITPNFWGTDLYVCGEAGIPYFKELGITRMATLNRNILKSMDEKSEDEV